MKSRKLLRLGLVAVPVVTLVILIPVLRNGSPTAPLAAKPNTDSSIKAPPADSTDLRHSEDSRKLFKQFYDRIAAAQKDGKLVRVLHYGDSQIEADRVTGALRTKLQENFGGCGIGWLPVTEVSIARNNVLRETSGSWSRDELKQKNNSVRMGFGGIVNNYSGSSATVKLRVNKQSAALQQQADVLKVFYRGSGQTASLAVRSGNTEIGKQVLGGTSFAAASVDLPQRSWSDLKLDFTGPKSPEIYGLSLDAKSGVAVDNISLRGSSAVEFTSMDTSFFGTQMSNLDPGLIVLEFGLNVAPYVTDDYSYYEKQLVKQLGMIRRQAPQAAVLVVGISDASRKKNGKYESYPNLEKIRNAQRNAAEKTGCAFWDLRAVMGGNGSMEDWSKKKLCEKDHMHFSNDGAALVGGKLYDALMRDYTRLTGKAAPGTKATAPDPKQTASK